MLGWLHSVARAHVDIALQHPIKLIANALGSPPKDIIDLAHERGVPVGQIYGCTETAPIATVLPIFLILGYALRGSSQDTDRLTLLREEELNLETAFMALTKGITS